MNVQDALDALDRGLRKPGPLRDWLRSRRWCGASLPDAAQVAVKDRAILAEGHGEAIAWLLATAQEGPVSVPWNLIFSLSDGPPEGDAFELRFRGGAVHVVEAERSEMYAQYIADGFAGARKVRTASDDLHFRGVTKGPFRGTRPTPAPDSTNLLVRFLVGDHDLLFKSYKRLDAANREPDILQRLHRKGFPNVPPYAGELALGRGEDRLVLGVATEFVEGEDAFTWLTEAWRETLGTGADDVERTSIAFAASLGEATAALHEALFDHHPGPFQAETFLEGDAQAARKAALSNLSDALAILAELARGKDAHAAGLAADARERLFVARERIESALAGIDATVGTAKGVTHADLHLAQVLRRGDGALFFLDFEGEPERGPGERATKHPPLRDIATTNRSFAYVAHYAWRAFTGGEPEVALRLRDPDVPSAWAAQAQRLVTWERDVVEAHMRACLAASSLYHDLLGDEARRAIAGWAMEKALYELRYELKHRPENLFIPLEGALTLAAP